MARESKNNANEDKHESIKNIAIIKKENISNEIQKPSIKKDISREELITKKDQKLEKFDFNKIQLMSDNEARDYLCGLKGIGEWTADCYLMACLGRQDIWPLADIGLQEGVKKLLNLKQRPDQNKMIQLAKKWKPYRSVAANLLWNDYDD